MDAREAIECLEGQQKLLEISGLDEAAEEYAKMVVAFRSAVEDQERLDQAEAHVMAGRVIDYGPYSKQFEILEYPDDDEMHTVVCRGASLRTALDAARTPNKEPTHDR